MSATPCISENDAICSSPIRDPGLATGVFSFTRRKQILIGTNDKVNALRTVARRTALIARLVGPATAYYLWLVERIGAKDRTRFWGVDAADAHGVSERTIKNHNSRLKVCGLIQINLRTFKGQNTYAEYILLPVNDLIGDDGHGPSATPFNRVQAFSPGPSEKLFPAKRARKEKRSLPSVVNTSSPHPSGSENAEAGRSASAGFATKGGAQPAKKAGPHTTLKAKVASWSETNINFLIECGFKERTHQSLTKDAITFLTKADNTLNESMWENFITAIWPRLKIKLPANSWLTRNTRSNLGPGWLFRWSDKYNEPNFMTIVSSQTYDDIWLPEILYPVGELVWHSGCKSVHRILSVSRSGYRSCPARFSDAEVTPDSNHSLSWYEAKPLPLSGSAPGTGSEAVALASGGPALALVVSERAPTPPDDAEGTEDGKDEPDNAPVPAAVPPVVSSGVPLAVPPVPAVAPRKSRHPDSHATSPELQARLDEINRAMVESRPTSIKAHSVRP